MFSLTLGELAELIGGELHGESNVALTGVTTDSRAVKPGDLFCAIVGEHFDGHDAVEQALTNGAVAVLGTHIVAGNCVVIPVLESSCTSLYTAALRS